MRITQTLTSYLLGEQLRYTYIFILTLLGLFFATSEISSIIRKIAEAGIQLKTALYIVAMHLPGGIVDCLPAAVLIATLLVLHRMCVDSEMVALLTSGISFPRIVSVFLLSGLIWSAFSLVISEYVVPPSKRLTWGLMAAGVCGSDMPVAKSHTADVQTELDGENQIRSSYMFADNYFAKHLSNVTVILTLNNSVISVMNAAKGTWKGGRWTLSDGRIFNIGNQTGESFTRFGKIEIPASKRMRQAFEQSTAGPEDYSTAELMQYIDSHGGPKAQPHLLHALYRRYSKPFGCLFILIACTPMALSGRRARTWSGLAYAGIILCIYYSLSSAVTGLAENGRVEPFLAAWIPNIAVGVLGVVLLFFKSRQQSL